MGYYKEEIYAHYICLAIKEGYEQKAKYLFTVASQECDDIEKIREEISSDKYLQQYINYYDNYIANNY